MKIYIDILHTVLPAEITVKGLGLIQSFSYTCVDVPQDFESPERAFRIWPFEREGFWISLEDECDGIEYYQSSFLIDIDAMCVDLIPAFLENLTKALNKNFSKEIVSLIKLQQLAEQMRQNLSESQLSISVKKDSFFAQGDLAVQVDEEKKTSLSLS